MKNSFSALIDKVEHSFCAALKGEEQIKTLIWYWGVIAYFFFYFVIEKSIKKIDFQIVDIILSVIGVVYFAWHIFVMKKCSPKKPKLTKEEKTKKRKEAIANFPKSFMRKLLLQEPITKFNPITVVIVLDLLFLLNFLGYLI